MIPDFYLGVLLGLVAPFIGVLLVRFTYDQLSDYLKKGKKKA